MKFSRGVGCAGWAALYLWQAEPWLQDRFLGGRGVMGGHDVGWAANRRFRDWAASARSGFAPALRAAARSLRNRLAALGCLKRSGTSQSHTVILQVAED